MAATVQDRTGPSSDRIWLSSYPPGTPAEIPPLAYESIGDALVHYCDKYADRPAFISMGKALSFRDLETQSARIGAWLQSRGQVPTVEASQAKLYAAELSQRVAQGGLRVLGLPGALHEQSGHAAVRGRFHTAYLWSVSQTYAGGSVEIQRGIIATRGLGLPRG